MPSLDLNPVINRPAVPATSVTVTLPAEHLTFLVRLTGALGPTADRALRAPAKPGCNPSSACLWAALTTAAQDAGLTDLEAKLRLMPEAL
jgi:hypothetical protein